MNNNALFGEYELIETLNKDSGEAYILKVRHIEYGDIKVLRVPKTSIKSEEDEAFLKFKDECKKLLRLSSHPNIVRIYRPRFWKEPGEEEGKAYVEMEFVDGKDLVNQREDEQDFVPIEDVLRMATQISSALAFCHVDVYKECMTGKEKKEVESAENEEKRNRIIERLIIKYKEYRVVHNDIHSNNIMRRKNGDYVLLDFGLAFDGTEVVRKTKMEGGVIPFMAPEKLKALQKREKLREEELTPQLDIYGFGVVLYEYLTGELPDKDNLDKNSIDQAVFNSRKQNFEKKYPGEKYTKDYPDWLVDVIIICLRKDREEHFDDGKDLHDYIVDHLKETKEGGVIIRHDSDKDKDKDEHKDKDDEKGGGENDKGNNRRRFFIIALILLLCGLGAYFGFFRKGNQQTPPTPQFEITVKSNQPNWGTATGGCQADSLAVVTIKAEAKEGCQFVQWNDGNRDSIRTVVADHDQEFIAYFKERPQPRPVTRFEITVGSNHPDWGMVSGGREADSLDVVKIKAEANEGYQFVKWDDGNKDKIREVVADRDKKYVAIFEAELIGEDPNPLPKESTKEYGFGTYSGPLENGIPGPGRKGTMYYNCHIQIAKHATDKPTHYAEEGDYFEGYWYNGDIEFGILFDKNGKKKEKILASKRVVPYNLNDDECE